MKNVYLFALGIVATLLLLGGNVEARAAGCDAIGNVRFICDQLGPEDLVCSRIGLGALVWSDRERKHSCHQPARQDHDRALSVGGDERAAEQENL